jgi:hypothetical protein
MGKVDVTDNEVKTMTIWSEGAKGDVWAFMIQIPYTLPLVDLFRSSTFRSKAGQRMDWAEITRQREIAYALMLSSGKLSNLQNLSAYAKGCCYPLCLKISYSRPKYGRAFDQANCLFIVDKLIFDPLVKKNILIDDKDINCVQPVYLGNSDKPLLKLEFAAFPKDLDEDEEE